MFKLSMFLIVSALLSDTALFAKSPNLHLKAVSKVTYECNQKEKVIARYYTLSDDSLSFVKLSFKNHSYTLPQIVSASGARYSDLHEVEWWSKGDQATFTTLYKEPKNNSFTCIERK